MRSIPTLADDPALEYGFLLHDIGKIGVPDQILLKPVELNEAEWRVMKAHTVLGAQMIGGVAFLHERRRPGRPLAPRALGRSRAIPTASSARRSRSARGSSRSPTRVDAITNHRPYRAARSWRDCRREIVAQKGTQFDPMVVDAFCDREHVLHEIRREFLAAA